MRKCTDLLTSCMHGECMHLHLFSAVCACRPLYGSKVQAPFVHFNRIGTNRIGVKTRESTDYVVSQTPSPTGSSVTPLSSAVGSVPSPVSLQTNRTRFAGKFPPSQLSPGSVPLFGVFDKNGSPVSQCSPKNTLPPFPSRHNRVTLTHEIPRSQSSERSQPLSERSQSPLERSQSHVRSRSHPKRSRSPSGQCDRSRSPTSRSQSPASRSRSHTSRSQSPTDTVKRQNSNQRTSKFPTFFLQPVANAPLRSTLVLTDATHKPRFRATAKQQSPFSLPRQTQEKRSPPSQSTPSRSIFRTPKKMRVTKRDSPTPSRSPTTPGKPVEDNTDLTFGESLHGTEEDDWDYGQSLLPSEYKVHRYGDEYDDNGDLKQDTLDRLDEMFQTEGDIQAEMSSDSDADTDPATTVPVDKAWKPLTLDKVTVCFDAVDKELLQQASKEMPAVIQNIRRLEGVRSQRTIEANHVYSYYLKGFARITLDIITDVYVRTGRKGPKPTLPCAIEVMHVEVLSWLYGKSPTTLFADRNATTSWFHLPADVDQERYWRTRKLLGLSRSADRPYELSTGVTRSDRQVSELLAKVGYTLSTKEMVIDDYKSSISAKKAARHGLGAFYVPTKRWVITVDQVIFCICQYH